MIQSFQGPNNSCHVHLDAVLKSADADELINILSKPYKSWHIEFLRVYSVGKKIVDALYGEIFENKKNISITTHKNKLNSYLHRLGFTTKLEVAQLCDVHDMSNINIVLIGGSADSSQKIIDIVKSNNWKNLSLVIVQHVNAMKKGIFDTILQRYTEAKVKYASSGEVLQCGTIYLAPSKQHLLIKNACIYLSDGDKYNFSRPSISLSYESFSNFYKEKLVVIHECGYADDGVDKLSLLKKNTTKIIIQREEECVAKPMIQNALELNVQDYVLKTQEIVSYVQLLNMELSRESYVSYLLEMVYKIHAYDFRLYNTDMLQRRLKSFMIKHKIKNIKNAISVILFNKSAFKGFFLELSINVTELFRNPESFKVLSQLSAKFHSKSYNLKVWSAGCSSGEEVYSTAIVLDNVGLLEKSTVYATDFNDVVLREARNGLYTLNYWEKAKSNYKELGFENNLDKYFTKNKHYVTINEYIRKKTLFFRHNLALDSSFNEFDIILCKNVIIYFDNELQEKVLKLFYDSLKFGGHLVLGESEMLPRRYNSLFERCSNNCKIFRKIA